MAVVFLLLSALSVFILRRETDRSRILMQWDASRLASLLLEVDLNQSLLEDPELLKSIERIRAFGIYDADGRAQSRYKAAPGTLERYDLSELSDIFITDREHGTLIYIRPYAATRGGLLWSPPVLSAFTARFLFIELDIRDLLRRQALYNVALAAVPVLIAGLTLLAGLSALRNAQYREQLVAQERLARLGEAARTLAHELKNPLNVIRLRARLARRGAAAEAAADLDVVDQEVEHLAGLTDRIREFLQDPVGTPELIDLETQVRELCARSGWETAISDDGKGPHRVRFDPSRLRSVVENLVRNAREAAPGQPVEITLRSGREGVVLSVLDRGPGIQLADQERVFDPFYTTKTTGSGIGLSISRRFVEAAGGAIRLTPREGGGTEASVILKGAT